jgi:hypothetical protein
MSRQARWNLARRIRFHLDVHVGVEQNIFRLQIAMNDSVAMAVVDGGDNLREDSRRFLLLHASMRHEMIEDFTAAGVLRHEIDRVLRLHHLVEPCDVRMVEELQDGDLAERLGQVVLVEACLVDDFDGNLSRESRDQLIQSTTCAKSRRQKASQ